MKPGLGKRIPDELTSLSTRAQVIFYESRKEGLIETRQHPKGVFDNGKQK